MCFDAAPLHDPHDRTLLTAVDGWEVRVMPEHDFRYGYFAKRGMLHLQLWRPGERVSVVTPCKLTGVCWELCSARIGKLRVRTRAMLERVLLEHVGLRAPNPATIDGLEFWFVRLPSGSIFDIEIRAIG